MRRTLPGEGHVLQMRFLPANSGSGTKVAADSGKIPAVDLVS